MNLLYADTSALVRAFLGDEGDAASLRKRLFEGDVPVVTSELTRVELASAVTGAMRGGRVPADHAVLELFDQSCDEDGPLTLVALIAEEVMPLAQRLVIQHHVRTLDALHLAVAVNDARPLADGGPISFITCDKAQAKVAQELGFDCE